MIRPDEKKKDRASYQPPKLTKLGSVRDLTLANKPSEPLEGNRTGTTS